MATTSRGPPDILAIETTNGATKNMIPSIKKILSIPGVDKETAMDIRAALETYENIPYYNRPHPESVMRKIDRLLETHGVEYQKKGRGAKSPAFYYCNAGDPYNGTVLYIFDKGFRVGCWGDIVERGRYE